MAREAGGAWVAQLLHGGLRYVGAFLAVRILGASAFGAYSLALAVTGAGSVVSALGFSPGLLPFLSRVKRTGDPSRVGALVRTSLVLATGASIVVGAGIVLGAPWLSAVAFHNPRLSAMLTAMSPLVTLGAVVAVLTTFLQAFLAVKERAWIEKVIVTGFTVAGLALGWIFGWGWPGVVAATLAGPAAGIVCAGALLARLWPGALVRPERRAWSPAGELLASCWPLLGTSILLYALVWSDIVIMGIFRDDREVGIYGLCARLAAGVALVQENIGQVFLPRLSDLFAADDRGGMRRLYHLAARWSIWPALVLAVVLMLWGRPLLTIFGADFAEGAAPLAVLAAAKALGVCGGMSGRIFAVTGRARLQLWNLVLMVACHVALNLLWVPRHGAMGAAAATLVSVAAVNALQVVQVGVLFRLLPWDRRAAVPIVGVTVLGLAALPFRGGLVPFLVFSAACAGLFLAWGIGAEERDVWRAIRGRLGGRRGR